MQTFCRPAHSGDLCGIIRLQVLQSYQICNSQDSRKVQNSKNDLNNAWWGQLAVICCELFEDGKWRSYMSVCL
jgi:hypothetical protein